MKIIAVIAAAAIMAGCGTTKQPIASAAESEAQFLNVTPDKTKHKGFSVQGTWKPGGMKQAR